MWHGVPFARQRRPIIGVLRMCWLLWGSFDCFGCPHTSAAAGGSWLERLLHSPTTAVSPRPSSGSLGLWCPSRLSFGGVRPSQSRGWMRFACFGCGTPLGAPPPPCVLRVRLPPPTGGLLMTGRARGDPGSATEGHRAGLERASWEVCGRGGGGACGGATPTCVGHFAAPITLRHASWGARGAEGGKPFRA